MATRRQSVTGSKGDLAGRPTVKRGQFGRAMLVGAPVSAALWIAIIAAVRFVA